MTSDKCMRLSRINSNKPKHCLTPFVEFLEKYKGVKRAIFERLRFIFLLWSKIGESYLFVALCIYIFNLYRFSFLRFSQKLIIQWRINDGIYASRWNNKMICFFIIFDEYKPLALSNIISLLFVFIFLAFLFSYSMISNFKS